MRLTDGSPPPLRHLTPTGRVKRVGVALERFAELVEQYRPRPDELLVGTAAADAWTRFLGGLARLELRHDELLAAIAGPPDRKFDKSQYKRPKAEQKS